MDMKKLYIAWSSQMAAVLIVTALYSIQAFGREWDSSEEEQYQQGEEIIESQKGPQKRTISNLSDLELMFSLLDRDQDGIISYEEAKEDEKLSNSFVVIDSDENGDIDIDEYYFYYREATAVGEEDSESE